MMLVQERREVKFKEKSEANKFKTYVIAELSIQVDKALVDEHGIAHFNHHPFLLESGAYIVHGGRAPIQVTISN